MSYLVELDNVEIFNVVEFEGDHYKDSPNTVTGEFLVVGQVDSQLGLLVEIDYNGSTRYLEHSELKESKYF